MKRTNMYFPIQTHQTLLRLARAERVSVAELVRNFVEKGLEKKKRKSWVDSFKKMSKTAKESHLGDLASRHDKYLYG